MVKFTETEFSFNALLASPLDFKNPVFSAKAEMISIPSPNSLAEKDAIGTPSKILKKVSSSMVLMSWAAVLLNKIVEASMAFLQAAIPCTVVVTSWANLF
ncbi:MAG: Uncharacterised protein [Flavobacteriaceae bacterium]|nr:MAG: Uncharacterised protein [Flavobacteriaceae bacterium]